MESARILIIEETIDSAAILKDYLNSMGLENIYISTNLEIMAEKLCQEFFEVILIDTGLVLREKKIEYIQEWLEKNIEVVLIHWEYDENVVLLIKKYPALRYLEKPYDKNQVNALAASLQKMNSSKITKRSYKS